ATPGLISQNLTPLIMALLTGQQSVVAGLLSLKAGVNINRAVAYNLTALHFAAAFGQRSVLVTLLNHGASLRNATNSTTVLHSAALSDEPGVMSILIAKMRNNRNFGGVDPVDDFGRTPFYLALKHNYQRVAQVLKANGANFTRYIDYPNGPSLLHVAA